MFIKAHNSYWKFQLDLQNQKSIKNRKSKSLARTTSCTIGMLLMFVFVMSLMIVKVTSTANFQNQTHAALQTRGTKNFVTPIITTDKASTITTTTATIIEPTKKLRKRKLIKQSISNRTLTVESVGSEKKSPQTRRSNWKLSSKFLEKKKMRSDAVQQVRDRLPMQQQQQKIYHRQVQQQQQQQQLQQRQQNHHQQQKKYQNEQQYQQQEEEEKYEERKSQRVTGEKAYLVEHADVDDSAHEQPIYGTWRAKARRSQAQLAQSQQNSATAIATATPSSQPTTTTTLPEATSNATTTAIVSTTLAEFPPAPTPTTLANVTAAAAVIIDDENQRQNDYQKYHVYERLPRRSSTMTTIKNDLHDQIPRPPRLTSRRPSSLLLRRQYLDTPVNTTASLLGDYDERPKPFHFPYEGPLPAEFKKVEPERSAVNNIQDILQQLHLSSTPVPTRSTQLVMMPTGLHIAGSFKNLKASGIANFFRSKRNKKPAQLTFPIPVPMPMPMTMPMPMQFYGAYQPHMYPYPLHHNPQQQQYHYSQLHSNHQPYQRIAMDQIYPFKPRSPIEVNLLAMQQQQQQQQQHQHQQQQQQFNSKRFTNRNKKKKNKHANLYDFSNNNNALFMQQTMTNQRPENFMPHYPLPQQPSVTQKPPKLRRIPFKLNLDIYPVIAAAKEPIPLPIRTPLVLASPYAEYTGMRYPIGYSPSIYNPYVHPQTNDQSSAYNAVRYRSPTPSPPTANQTPAQAHTAAQVLQSNNNNSNNNNNNNMQITFPDQIPKYSQQLQKQQFQQQQFQRPQLNPEENSFQPMDCIDSTETEAVGDAPYNSNSNQNPNQFMVHLNVFPKQAKPSGVNFAPTNPFYNMQHRHAITNMAIDTNPIEPRHFPRPIPISSANTTQQQMPQRIARSDATFPFLADFDQPIVAADPSIISSAKSKVSSKLDISDIPSHYEHITMRNKSAIRADIDPHLEQMAKEAKAASLFRFPVEDLIQFQVDDAL